MWKLIIGGGLAALNFAIKGGYRPKSSLQEDGFNKTVSKECKNVSQSIAKGVKKEHARMQREANNKK